MKNSIRSFAKNFKYMTAAVAILISMNQIYFLLTNDDSIKEINKNGGFYCITWEYISVAFFKCTLAFLAGMMICDNKFIKCGNI